MNYLMRLFDALVVIIHRRQANLLGRHDMVKRLSPPRPAPADYRLFATYPIRRKLYIWPWISFIFFLLLALAIVILPLWKDKLL
jgi:hypothetical protein